MKDDELRSRLRRVDPAAASPTHDRASDARAQTLLEAIMATPVDTPVPEDTVPARATGARRWLVPVTAAAAVGAVALSATLLTGGGDDRRAPDRAAAAPLRLTAPASDGTTMQSCLMFDEKILADMPTAFGGTVTSVGSGTVTLDVDRWFKPADSDVETVELSTGTGAIVSIDGVEFTEGTRYLVTASQDGTVNTCGYSGEATADYEAAWERAFGAG